MVDAFPIKRRLVNGIGTENEKPAFKRAGGARNKTSWTCLTGPSESSLHETAQWTSQQTTATWNIHSRITSCAKSYGVWKSLQLSSSGWNLSILESLLSKARRPTSAEEYAVHLLVPDRLFLEKAMFSPLDV